jgi:hypothetical protein
MQRFDCALRAAILIGITWLSTQAPLDAQATAPAAIERGPWEFAAQFGLTSFGVDQSAPGAMSTLGVSRRLTSRFSLGLEGGLGSIETTKVCRLGNLLIECAQNSTWPSLGLGGRFVFMDANGSASRYYFVVQGVAHGPDLVASYDLGAGLSLRTVVGMDVGVELRHRFGYDGASGGMYFFRMTR